MPQETASAILQKEAAAAGRKSGMARVWRRKAAKQPATEAETIQTEGPEEQQNQCGKEPDLQRQEPGRYIRSGKVAEQG